MVTKSHYGVQVSGKHRQGTTTYNLESHYFLSCVIIFWGGSSCCRSLSDFFMSLNNIHVWNSLQDKVYETPVMPLITSYLTLPYLLFLKLEYNSFRLVFDTTNRCPALIHNNTIHSFHPLSYAMVISTTTLLQLFDSNSPKQ